ncbi:putative nuclease HARBI1 [Montipora capricornis]|uniref:putative nuclease HARBI1 n=1 Tax=Montipora capricornis TaxID=246305 RepID=UPI0035F17A90
MAHLPRPAVLAGVSAGSFPETAGGNRAYRVQESQDNVGYPRPQFWFEQLFLNRYQDHLWREHFRTFGIGRCTAMNVKDEFCSALMRRANDFIKFPKTETETSQAIQKFQDISHFPQVVGAFDGSHIPIKAPKEDPNDYVNRKSFHSIVLQGVADANGKFLHVSTGYAGSIHNARMLRMRSLLTAIEDGDILHSPLRRIGGMQVKPPIVADPAYKLTTWCMKPFPQTRTMTDSQREKCVVTPNFLFAFQYHLLRSTFPA